MAIGLLVFGVQVAAAVAAVTVYSLSIGLAQIQRILGIARSKYDFAILPEPQGYGLASAAGLLFWGIGIGLPGCAFVLAALQTTPLSPVDQVTLAISGLLVLLSLYALLVEPHWIVIRRHDLPLPGIPSEFDEFRIVHVSDPHFRRPGPGVARAVRRITALEPDLICVTGDLADRADTENSPGVMGARQFFRGLKANYGVFVVYGDWDGLSSDWPSIETAIFRGTMAEPLNDAIRKIDVDGATLNVMGRAPAHLKARRDYLSQLPTNGLSIVLHHFPFGAIRAAEVGAHLYLAGHTHGGQIRLPFVGRLYSSARGGTDRAGRSLARRFNSGLHHLGETWVHIARGLGTRGGDAPPIRFCCRPEITMLTIRKKTNRCIPS